MLNHLVFDRHIVVYKGTLNNQAFGVILINLSFRFGMDKC